MHVLIFYFNVLLSYYIDQYSIVLLVFQEGNHSKNVWLLHHMMFACS
jgi:hypothetical protein